MENVDCGGAIPGLPEVAGLGYAVQMEAQGGMMGGGMMGGGMMGGMGGGF